MFFFEKLQKNEFNNFYVIKGIEGLVVLELFLVV